jgi:hypothetical protein
MGCRVEPAGDEVTLFLPRQAAGRTLENLASNGRVAAVFARPLDDLSFQLKGEVLEVRDATEADRPIIERYRPLLAEMFQFVGIPSRITFAMAVWPAAAVRFRVESIFVQTPGPKAGAPLVEGRG